MKNAETSVVILAGGRGARFDHESQVLPKPLIEVAGKPIIEHIIDGFRDQGFRDFIVATGHLAHEFYDGPNAFDRLGIHGWWGFDGYDTSTETARFIGHHGDATIRCVHTGDDSNTAERLLSLKKKGFLDRRFVLTYGDGLSDVKISDVLEEHERDYTKFCWARYEDGRVAEHPAHRAPLVTLTAVRPPGRFGSLRFNGTYHHHVREFWEKAPDDWISGGFMLMEPEFIDRYLAQESGARKLESEALPACAAEWLLRAYRHYGYWQCMDTRRDLEQIEADVAANDGVLPWRNHDDDDDDGRRTEAGEEADP